MPSHNQRSSKHTIAIDSTAEVYLELLRDRGIEYFFGNGGIDFTPLVEAFAKSAAQGGATPKPMTVPHEYVAVSMADGFYRVTGRPQAVMVHVIVGTANAAGAIMNAARAHIPILYSAGRTPITDVQHQGDALPGLEELGRQAPQTEGTVEQHDQGFAVLGVATLGIGLDALHHLLLHLCQAGHTPHLLGSWRLVPGVSSRPTHTCRCWSDQECRQRFGRAGLGSNRVADPHQRFCLLLPLRSWAQLGRELGRLLLEHGDALPVKTSHEELARGVLWAEGPLRRECLVVLRGFRCHLHQNAFGPLEVQELREQACTFLEGVLDGEQGHPLLQDVRVAPLGEVNLCVQRADPGLPGQAVTGPDHRELSAEGAIVPPTQLVLSRQEDAVGPHDGWSDIPRPALGKVERHRRQPDGQQSLEDALLRFVRLQLSRAFPGTREQGLERLLAFRSTHLDIECVHGDPPDVANHWSIAQMFPGFYRGRRVPRTQKPSSRATLPLNSFRVRSIQMGIDPFFSRYPVRGYPCDIPIVADSSVAIPLLTQELGRSRAKAERLIDERFELVKAQHEAQQRAVRERLTQVRSEKPIEFEWVSHCIDQVKDDETMLVNEYDLDLTQVQLTLPGSYYAPSPAAGLGWETGAAPGVKLAALEKTVIATLGEGACMFGCPTAAHFVSRAYHLPVLFVIFNNQCWNAVKRATKGVYPNGWAAKTNNWPLTDLTPSPLFERMADVHGAYGELVEDPPEVLPALRRGLKAVRQEKRQAILNVICKHP